MPALRYLTRPTALTLATALFAACSDHSNPTSPSRVLTTVAVSFGSQTIEVGELTGATASGLDQRGSPIAIGAVNWNSDAPTIAVVNPTTGFIFAIAPGTTRISASVDGQVGFSAITVVRPAAIQIDDVRPAGTTDAGRIALRNPTSAQVDLTGWTLVDNVFSMGYTFPAGSIIAPNGSMEIDGATLPFRIDELDSILLFSRFGVLVDRRPTTL